MHASIGLALSGVAGCREEKYIQKIAIRPLAVITLKVSMQLHHKTKGKLGNQDSNAMIGVWLDSSMTYSHCSRAAMQHGLCYSCIGCHQLARHVICHTV